VYLLPNSNSSSCTQPQHRHCKILVYNYIFRISCLIYFPSETASLSKFGFSTCWLTERYITGRTENYSLCMTEYGCDLKASRTLDIHEEAIGALHESFKLVGAGLLFGCWIQKIDRHSIIFLKILLMRFGNLIL